MKNNCLYCYEPLREEVDFHEKCSTAFFGTSSPPLIPYSLNEMADLAKLVIERSVSVPGVQAKLSMSVVEEAQQKTAGRLTVVDALGGRYIFKPPSNQYAEMPANEHVTMRIAEAFGIRVVPASLIKLKSGELSYITKRIDRSEVGDKIHLLDMFQVTEAFDKYKSSMEKIGKAIHDYSTNTLLDKIFFFELAVFSFLTGNNDMHLKIFSMIESAGGWMLAPAYDLLNVAIVNPADNEELALPIEGKKKKLTRQNFQQLGRGLGLTEKQINGTFKRMAKNRAKAQKWVEKSFLSAEMKSDYAEILASRYAQLEL